MKTLKTLRETTSVHPDFRPRPLKVQDVYDDGGVLIDRKSPNIDFITPIPDEIADVPPVVDLADPVSLAHVLQDVDKHQPETPIDLDAMQAIDMAKQIKSNLS